MAATTPDFLVAPPVRQDAPRWYRLARRVREYGLLMRLDRPIGTWLLLWPVLWALCVAGSGHPGQKVLIIFVVGVVVMRAAGCIINDLADRNIDPHVKRTRERPLAARRVSPHEAIGIFVLLGAAALWLVTRLDPFTVKLSIVGAALTVSYPLAKRFFALPQLYLGISFGGWGIPMAFSAQLHALPRVAWMLFIAAVIWAVVYDTLYAMVDREDDLKLGVRSTAILFADMDKAMIGLLQALMLADLVLAGRSMHFGPWYRAGLGAAAILFAYQQSLIRRRDPAACFKAFLNNNYVGMVIFLGIALQYLYAGR